MKSFELENRRCLVLGASGPLGLNLCNALADARAHVIAYGRSALPPYGLHPRVKWVAGDINDIGRLKAAVRLQEFVFHLVSATIPEISNRYPAADLEANAISTIRLLEICCAERVNKVIFSSSGGTVYGVPSNHPIPETAPTDPISSYGISKLVIEKYLALFHQTHGLDFQIFRISNIYGPYQHGNRRQGLVATTIQRALEKSSVEVWGDGQVVRDYIYVDDVVSAMIHGCFYAGRHKVMNVGSGTGLSVNQVIDDIEYVLDEGRIDKVFRPARAVDVPVNVLDTSLIRTETSWRPIVGWLNGLRRSIDWMKSSASPIETWSDKFSDPREHVLANSPED
jgi:UDP-glucose 4-epimerase